MKSIRQAGSLIVSAEAGEPERLILLLQGRERVRIYEVLTSAKKMSAQMVEVKDAERDKCLGHLLRLKTQIPAAS